MGLYSALRGVPVYAPAYAGTYCAYPRRDGQAELTWVVIHTEMVYPAANGDSSSTNRARRRLTVLIEHTYAKLPSVNVQVRPKSQGSGSCE